MTPNGLVSLSVNNDLTINTLTGIRPDSVVIKLVATATGKERHHNSNGDTYDPSFSGSTCSNSAALAGAQFPLITAGMLAWGTTIHASPAGPYSVTETPFLPATSGRQRPLRHG